MILQERLTYNGKEVTNEELMAIFMRLAKTNCENRDAIQQAASMLIGALNSKTTTLHNLYKNYIRAFSDCNCMEFWRYLSSNIVETRITILKEYFEENKIWEIFNNNLFNHIHTISASHLHRFTTSKEEAMRLLVINISALGEVIDHAFHWDNTKEGWIFWNNHYCEFKSWIYEKGFNPLSYTMLDLRDND